MDLANAFRAARFGLRKARLGIAPGELVLDIGSGDNPLPRADLVCDKYIDNCTHRRSGLTYYTPVVAGDVERLPFGDKSFDFVYCSHVLEHVSDPVKACAELSRVGKRGYIETPSELFERFMGGVPSHRWVVSLDGGQLHFRSKRGAYTDERLAGLIGTLNKQRNQGLAAFTSMNAPALHVMLRWSGEVRAVVEAGASSWATQPEVLDVPDGPSSNAVPPPDRLVRLWRTSLRLAVSRKRSRLRLDEILASPCCTARLERSASGLVCRSCGAAYPVRDAIPRLLLPEAVHTGSASGALNFQTWQIP